MTTSLVERGCHVFETQQLLPTPTTRNLRTESVRLQAVPLIENMIGNVAV